MKNNLLEDEPLEEIRMEKSPEEEKFDLYHEEMQEE